MVIVQKYGGSSVATTEQISEIAFHIKKLYNTGQSLVVVASAMGKTTNRLIGLANEITETPNKRELDSLISTGEVQTVSLLSIALQKLGVPSISLTGSQAGIITNKNHTHAFVKEIKIHKIKKYLAKKYVVIVAGFQGVTENGDITTLGRGGSDTTAVCLASMLDVPCEIYTDVNGIFTIDPRLYPNAKKLDRITYDEMMEMAVGGARVLEPRSVELAKKNNISLYLGKTLVQDKTRGTYIMNNTTEFENMPIKNLSLRENASIITIEIEHDITHTLSRLFECLESLNINLEMLCNQRIGNKNIISFCVPASSVRETLEAIYKNKYLKKTTINCENNLNKIILVGIGFLTHKNITNRIFRILFDNGIVFSHISMTEISLSFTINYDDTKNAIAILAKELNL